MTLKKIIILMLGGWLLAGCASAPQAREDNVRLGMSRDELRAHFGEPLRIVKTPEGGEDWYYHFSDHWTYASETMHDSNGHTTYNNSATWQSPADTVERPVHVAFDGYVMGPLPEGKVAGN